VADDILILYLARILEQLQKHRTIVPVEIFTLAKSKDPPSDALPRFLAVFTSNQRIGSLSKETYAGKLIDEWNNVLAASDKKPEVVDIASAISTFMSVKDDEELVRRLIKHQHVIGSDVYSGLKKVTRNAANLTVTLLTHYVAVKLETILDRETKISHDQFATQIEARLGSGEGESAKGPDMKVWGKGRGINDVGGTKRLALTLHLLSHRLIGYRRNFAIPLSSSLVRLLVAMT
jgi:nucleosome binding factor SPN SPT16 subunit